jgi:VWFA-related protein
MVDFTNDRAKLLEAVSQLQIAPPQMCRVSPVQVRQIELLKNVVKAMANLPGRREILLISGGFWIGHDQTSEPTELIEAAVRSKVIIDALDTGGGAGKLPSNGNGGQRPGDQAMESRMELKASTATLPLVLAELAHGTGGTYVAGNDYVVNFRKLSTPESYYVLSFVSTAKADGKLHQLKVKLDKDKKGKFTIEARNGYYAPDRAE